jgi:hypothetical protein
MKLDARDALRRGATTVAAARVAVGVVALAWPALPSRPWVGTGEAGGDLPSRVFGRALGGRDLALGLGALAALRQADSASGAPGEQRPASAWVAAGALSDAMDVAASLAAWRDLPRLTRWLVVGSAAGAALAGAAGAVALQSAPGSAAADLSGT